MAKEYPLLVGRRDRGHKWLRSILFNTFSILKQEKALPLILVVLLIF